MDSRRQFLQAARLIEVAHGKDNNLNLIRFVCASLVIFSHSWVLLGSPDPAQVYLHSWNLGDIAVRSFFFLSGYLILKSGLRGSDAEEFLAARVLRIFPALIVAVLACVFVLGPLLSVLPMRDYFVDPITWKFLREMVLYKTQDILPGVFAQGHLLKQVDGVLWTLPIEWTLYIATVVFCLAIRGKSFWGEAPIRTLLITIAAIGLTIQMMPLAEPLRVRSAVFYFVLGAICYSLRKWIFLSVPVAVLLAGVNLALFGFHWYGIGNQLFPVTLGYLLLTLGFHPAVLVRSFHRFGDYSYGLYIFAFPIQQAEIIFLHNSWMLFPASYPPALLAAVLSWHYIEKPCLSLKNRLRRSPKLAGTGVEMPVKLVQNRTDSSP